MYFSLSSNTILITFDNDSRLASIEHQIDIHVLDLVDASENPDISVSDILQGLKYVVDYR
jgi:hypothetical protein